MTSILLPAMLKRCHEQGASALDWVIMMNSCTARSFRPTEDRMRIGYVKQPWGRYGTSVLSTALRTKIMVL